MAKLKLILLLPAIIGIFMAEGQTDESWNFAKEKDGMKIYTRNEPNTNLKSYRGEADFKTDMNRLGSRLGNFDNLDWWDDDIKEITILHHERGKLVHYYIVYDAPWPVSDRDLCVQVHITKDVEAGSMTVFSDPYLDGVPEKKDMVRIKNYWQRWTVQDSHNGSFHITLEGFIDPGGIIPAWLYNMLITDTPLNIMGNLKKEVVDE